MSALYDTAREKFLRGELSWVSDDLSAMLVDVSEYNADLHNDLFLSDIPAIARLTDGETLVSKTTTAGVADANDVTFPSVTGDAVGAIVIYKDTGVDSTSVLVAYINSGTGIPVTPTGRDITVTWSDGASRIFKL